MGPGASGHGGVRGVRYRVMAREATIHELEDWERNGAEWRPAEIHSGRAVVDLCSCTGELMERVESEDPDFVEYVRARRDD